MADIKRLNYFNGQFLVEKDFQDEQAYHMGMRRLHNRIFHMWGVADGLQVTKTGDKQVSIAAGTAIDKDGKEIVLQSAQLVDLTQFAPNAVVYVTITYQEVSDPADHYTSGGLDNYTRTTERPKLAPSTALPPTDGSVISLAKVTLDATGIASAVDNSVQRPSSLKLAPGAVGSMELADGAVTSAKIQNSQLTLGQLILKNAATDSSKWPALTCSQANQIAVAGPLSVSGSVGIGTASPDRTLTVQGTVGTYLNVRDAEAGGPFEVLLGADSGGGIVSTMSNHDLQLRAGGNDTKMIIKANGHVGIGTTGPSAQLHVSSDVAVGPIALPELVGRLHVSGPVAELGFIRRTLAAWPAAAAAGDRFVWYNPDGTARLFTDGPGDLLSVTAQGRVDVKGALVAANSDLYFTQIHHNHTGYGNTEGFAAIENAENYHALMILGRSIGGYGRVVKLWDFLQVNGILDAKKVGTVEKDLAENYASDLDLVPGDVVSLDPDQDKIVRSKGANDELVLGVISAKPGFLLNANHDIEQRMNYEKMFPVALCGRVPCKVTDENGPVKRGDLLVASSRPGHAMKARTAGANGNAHFLPGTIIGKALGSLESGTGTIDVFVTLR